MSDVPTVDDLERAVDEALARGDATAAAHAIAMAWPHHVDLHPRRIRDLYDRVPPAAWEDDAWLVSGLAATYRGTSETDRRASLPYRSAVDLLLTADPPPAPIVRAAVLVHRAAGDRRVGRLAEARASLAEARRILDTERGAPLSVRISLQAALALQDGLVLAHLGAFTAARDELRTAEALAERHLVRTDRLECRGALAYVAYCLGEIEEARELVGRARELLSGAGSGPELARSGFRAPAEIAAALIAVDETRREGARAVLDDLRPACAGTDWELLGRFAEATVAAIQGLRLDALEHLRGLHNLGSAWEEHGPVPVMRDTLRASLLTHLGQTAAAWDLVRTLRPVEHHSTCPATVAGRLRVLADDHQGALGEMADCLALGDAHSGRTLMDVLLVVAAAHGGLGDRVRSDHAYDRAARYATSTGILRPFAVFPAAASSALLDRALEREQPPDVRRMLEAMRADRGAAEAVRVDPLTERERVIVACLAEGLTVSQMAGRLFISPNTVKSHVRSVYRKLDASTRAEAVDRARARGHDLRPGPSA
ncbi:LuxR family transcriptional regulator [Clavibacter nebraskensis]|uniref:Transcriptional regulator n=3 Tax=Clavibacter nebraskensis TaxID=31963 RepID=A0AAI8ZH02_9MICO|nr:LuxR family transcriptional regulator [Clavibacter nebraskensis]OAH20131.1 helix-turn-helix transcriptional regulator [Clavibacter nebraskensis]QGV66074.1 LuxR family transcriptional regulator [Clavibacter nebraskensis]QGV68873.1 LuxR family transcriptional regulator [Clavibacter nebraskensis]QGV71663.1 LuxR family transcriptional regulator [Clavibacter nebraskensis]UKF27757.1 LuxR family transcriptional regulator [Clavibacter nebraskensis]